VGAVVVVLVLVEIGAWVVKGVPVGMLLHPDRMKVTSKQNVSTMTNFLFMSAFPYQSVGFITTCFFGFKI